MHKTVWQFEFTLKTLSDTSLKCSEEICEGVKAAWEPIE